MRGATARGRARKQQGEREHRDGEPRNHQPEGSCGSAAELLDPRLEFRAVDAAEVDLRDHALERLVRRLWRPVAEQYSGLPAAQAGLVGEQEVEESSDGGLAVREPDRVGQLRG